MLCKGLNRMYNQKETKGKQMFYPNFQIEMKGNLQLLYSNLFYLKLNPKKKNKKSDQFHNFPKLPLTSDISDQI